MIGCRTDRYAIVLFSESVRSVYHNDTKCVESIHQIMNFVM
jgi:hypothetical protein